LLVLGVIALAVIATVVLAGEYSDHWGRKSAAQVPQMEPMELRGVWLGMRLAATDSASARALGVPPTVKGVVVAELAQGADSRGLGAGIQPGDVVVGVDGREIESLEELQSLTNKLDVLRPLPFQILRQGQPLGVVLPAPAGLGTPQATPVAWQRPVTTAPCPRWPAAGPAWGGR
jgi:membrane-associated protease RseP (regulator of RpoE activity)